VAIDERLTDDGCLRAATTNIDACNVSNIKPADGYFPPYEDVLPVSGKHGSVRISFNANMLATLVNALHAASGLQSADDGACILEMKDAMSPIIVTISGRTASQAVGVLMPINASGEVTGTPWKTEDFAAEPLPAAPIPPAPPAPPKVD
jgi:hypothetical protein